MDNKDVVSVEENEDDSPVVSTEPEAEKGVFEAASEVTEEVESSGPFRVRLANGGEVRFWKPLSELERIHPGATVINASRTR